jgi:hypothetical protein
VDLLSIKADREHVFVFVLLAVLGFPVRQQLWRASAELKDGGK